MSSRGSGTKAGLNTKVFSTKLPGCRSSACRLSLLFYSPSSSILPYSPPQCVPIACGPSQATRRLSPSALRPPPSARYCTIGVTLYLSMPERVQYRYSILYPCTLKGTVLLHHDATCPAAQMDTTDNVSGCDGAVT